MIDKAMKYIIALLSSLILTSCSMFNSEAPYKRFFSEKEYPIIKAIHDCDKDKILDMMHKGWNVNSMGKHGMSYLLYAIWEHNYDMTKKYRNGITKQEANDLFISDLSVTEEGVKKASESPFIPM